MRDTASNIYFIRSIAQGIHDDNPDFDKIYKKVLQKLPDNPERGAILYECCQILQPVIAYGHFYSKLNSVFSVLLEIELRRPLT